MSDAADQSINIESVKLEPTNKNLKKDADSPYARKVRARRHFCRQNGIQGDVPWPVLGMENRPAAHK